jgi:rhodanese-related sulfurtransferase
MKTCYGSKIIKQYGTTIPPWASKENVKESVPEELIKKYDPKTKLHEIIPDISETNTTIQKKIRQKDTWILYWTTKPTHSSMDVVSEDKAYDNYKNHGLVKSDSQGNITMKLCCPQLYRINYNTHPRHIHYTYVTSKNTWNLNVKTLVITCTLTYDQMKDMVSKKNYLIINALPTTESMIPGSVSLPVSELKDLDETKQKRKLAVFIKSKIKNNQSLQKLVDGGVKYQDIPMIVYCAHSKCSAADSLIAILLKRGYVNVMEYPGGIQEWFANEEKDEDEDEEKDEDEDDTTDEERTIVYEGVLYNISGNDVMDDNYKIIGTFNSKTNTIQWKPLYEKIHNRRKQDVSTVNIEEKASKKNEKTNKKNETPDSETIELIEDASDDIQLNQTQGITKEEFRKSFRGYGYSFF